MRTLPQDWITAYSNGNRNYLITVYMELADGTSLTIENDLIWQGGFSFEEGTSNSDSFDIGSAIIGKSTLVLNNIDEDFTGYDFYNAEFDVYLNLEGLETQDQRIGHYTVDDPQYNGSLITLNCLDNMWRFDIPFSDIPGISYPTTARAIINAMCGYSGIGIQLVTQSFNGYDFAITDSPDERGEMNCREVLQYIAQATCNFCKIDAQGNLSLKWYDKSKITGTIVDANLAQITQNFSSQVSIEDIVITGCRVCSADPEAEDGYDYIYVDSVVEQTHPRYILTIQDNPLINASNAQSRCSTIGAIIAGTPIRAFTSTSLNDVSIESGDPCLVKDFKANKYYSFVTNLRFTTSNSESFSCGAESIQQNKTVRYSNEIRTIVEAKRNAQVIVSAYDQEVKRMNALAQQAYGYREYTYTSGGNTIMYRYSGTYVDTDSPASASNPRFPDSNIVWKITAEGVFISTEKDSSGFPIFTNGYDANTGTALLSMIYTIGFQADWIKSGTLTLGGDNNVNGLCSVLDANGVEKVRIDKDGVRVGTTTDSKLCLTNGELIYYYDNVYAGKLLMAYTNYGTVEDPDYRDSFDVVDFDDVWISADNELRLYADSGDIDINAGDEIKINAPSITIGKTDDSVSILSDLRIDDNADIEVGTGSYGQGGTVAVINYQGNIETLHFSKGILTSDQYGNTPAIDFWHKENGSVIIGILAVGSTSFTFNSLESADYSYEPYVTCASGVDAPLLTGMSFSGNSCTVKYTAVTSAQAGSGNECQMKLRVIV